MRTHPTTLARVAALCALLAITPSLTGCPRTAFRVWEGVFGDANKGQIGKQREVNAKLQATYDARVKTHKAFISKSKAAIAAATKAGKVGEAIVDFNKYYSYMHPGIDKKKAALLAEEKLVDASYEQDALKGIIARTDELIGEARFEQLDVDLNAAHKIVRPAEREALTSRHARLKALWLEQLVKRADDADAQAPAAALVWRLKAAQLAAQINQPQQARTLASAASATRTKLLEAHRYRVAFQSASGAQAAPVRQSVEGHGWRANVQLANTSSAHALITLSTGAPAYQLQRSQRTGSFRYTASMRQVPNPKLKDFDRDIKYEQGQIKLRQRDIDGYHRRIKDLQTSPAYRDSNPDWKRGRIEEQQRYIRDREKQIQGHQAKIQKIQSKRSSTPPTISQPVYAQQSYPITVHTRSGSMDASVSIAHPDRRPAVAWKQRLTASASDESHSAHSKKDGSVSADPANPPSEDAIQRTLNAQAIKQVQSLVLDSLEQRRQALLQQQVKGAPARAHNLALYVLLNPERLDKAATDELVRLTSVTDAVALLSAR